MSKNKLTDLNDHLFAALERLGDESIKGEKLKDEIDRSKAITGVAVHVVSNARLVLDGTKFAHETRTVLDQDGAALPAMFDGKPALPAAGAGK